MRSKTFEASDPAAALDALADFFDEDPVGSNVVRGLLEGAAESGSRATVRWAAVAGRVVAALAGPGIVNPAIIVGRDPAGAAALAQQFARSERPPRSIQGSAGMAAAFAGEFATIARTAVRPVAGERVYEADAIQLPVPPHGHRRLATDDDVATAASFLELFNADTGLPSTDLGARAIAMIAAAKLHVWEIDGGAVGCAVRSRAAAGVARIGLVFTLAARRRRGIAGRLTAELAQEILDEGNRPILYTQLENPGSNALYQSLGFRPVAEHVRYALGPGR